MVGDDLNLRSV